MLRWNKLLLILGFALLLLSGVARVRAACSGGTVTVGTRSSYFCTFNTVDCGGAICETDWCSGTCSGGPGTTTYCTWTCAGSAGCTPC